MPKQGGAPFLFSKIPAMLITSAAPTVIGPCNRNNSTPGIWLLEHAAQW